MTRPSPSTAFLVIINALLLLGYAFYGTQNGLQMFFNIAIFVMLFVVASIYHLILWLCTRKRTLRNRVRIPLYILPAALVIIQCFALPKAPELPNQQPRLASGDKQYTMHMDMKDNRWTVSIYDRHGKKLYTDSDSDFRSQCNVYWMWDSENRLWLYNSDDSFVWYWTKTQTGWKKVYWGNGIEEKKESFYPPKALYPKYD
jgi:hypothetical protein